MIVSIVYMHAKTGFLGNISKPFAPSSKGYLVFLTAKIAVKSVATHRSAHLNPIFVEMLESNIINVVSNPRAIVHSYLSMHKW